jgi:hypothetical protein
MALITVTVNVSEKLFKIIVINVREFSRGQTPKFEHFQWSILLDWLWSSDLKTEKINVIKQFRQVVKDAKSTLEKGSTCIRKQKQKS